MKNLLVFSFAVAVCLLALDPEAHAEAAPAPCCGRGAAFIGGALIGGAIGRRRGGCGFGGCSGGWGGGGGWGGSCGGCYSCCGRKKRGITDGIHVHFVEDLHEKVALEDIDQCGLRLVCELSQKEDHKLTGNEKLIMMPYKGVGLSDGSNFGLYDEAAWHGQEGRECHKLYPLCGFSAPEIMWHTRQMNITDPSLDL
ncbi:unnamed protein product [Meganyctiphanes norvegica]|uniref:Uncharacterized protein n=1 Tax=Meganyctiphanes norvegica TaxID=48144 RepID=A0AAV2QWZ3_MEGNR